MKSMESMERYDIMKTDDIMEKLYVGLDIHQETLTKTAMNKEGKIEFCGTIPNTKEAVQCFSSVIPSPQVKIAVEACDLWRGVYKMLTEFGYHVVLANSVKTHQIAAAKKTDKGDSKTLDKFFPVISSFFTVKLLFNLLSKFFQIIQDNTVQNLRR